MKSRRRLLHFLLRWGPSASTACWGVARLGDKHRPLHVDDDIDVLPAKYHRNRRCRLVSLLCRLSEILRYGNIKRPKIRAVPAMFASSILAWREVGVDCLDGAYTRRHA